ncbi:MAG: helix-turn-helix domain-containing protein [Taibaiella sp.]|nr:helix-turn-helix domain-containing protein [Taibaiella sp.]
METKEINLLEIRDLLKVTQLEMANALGVSRRTLQNWEKSGAIPEEKIERLEAYASLMRKSNLFKNFLSGEFNAKDVLNEGSPNQDPKLESKKLKLIDMDGNVYEVENNAINKEFPKRTFEEPKKLPSDPYRNWGKGVPALPIKVQGGFARHYTDPIYWKNLERVHFPGLNLNGPEDKFLWAEMEGDSMTYYDHNAKLITGIQHGTWGLYEQIPKEYWRTGLRKYYVHLIITESLLTVKRVLQDNDEEIVLSPDNDIFEQERFHLKDIQGIYVLKRKLDWNAPPPRKHEIKV